MNSKIIKCILISNNIFIALTGVLILSVRSVFRYYREEFLGNICFEVQDYIAVFLIGALVKIFSLFGVYAAVKEYRSHLKAYAFIMSLLLMVSFGVVLYNSIIRERYSDFNVCGLNLSDLKYNSSNEAKRDLHQTKFKCCGWTGLNDYKENNTLNLPLSCYIESNSSNVLIDCCTFNNATLNQSSSFDQSICYKSELIYQNSCSSKVILYNNQLKHSLYAIVLVSAILTFSSIWLSLYLSSKIASKKRNKNQNPTYHHLNRRLIERS